MIFQWSFMAEGNRGKPLLGVYLFGGKSSEGFCVCAFTFTYSLFNESRWEKLPGGILDNLLWCKNLKNKGNF